MNSIKLEKISKKFGSLEAIEEISLEIKKGEFCGCLGPSGCGKSTLLSLIAGLEKPSSGELKNTFLRHHTSFVFQEPSLMPWCSIEKNVLLPLDLLHFKEQEKQKIVNDWLVKLGLEKFKYFSPQALSGGMKMRTSLARAMVTNPQLLLLDEPFSSLDQILRENLADEIFSLWHTKRFTSMLVTHNISEAIFLCDKIFILSQNPAHLIEVVSIEKDTQDLKYYLKNFRTSEKFNSYKQHIKEILQHEQS